MKAIETLLAAFPSRPLPVVALFGTDAEPREVEWVRFFADKTWIDVELDDLELGYEAFFHFDAAGFKYYLPSILKCTLSGGRPLHALSAVFEPLIGNSDDSKWTLKFAVLWRCFSTQQLQAIEDSLLLIWQDRIFPTEQWQYDSIIFTLLVLGNSDFGGQAPG